MTHAGVDCKAVFDYEALLGKQRPRLQMVCLELTTLSSADAASKPVASENGNAPSHIAMVGVVFLALLLASLTDPTESVSLTSFFAL